MVSLGKNGVVWQFRLIWRNFYGAGLIQSRAAQRNMHGSLVFSHPAYPYRVANTTSCRSWEEPVIDKISPKTLRRWRNATLMMNSIVGQLLSTWGVEAYRIYEFFAGMKRAIASLGQNH